MSLSNLHNKHSLHKVHARVAKAQKGDTSVLADLVADLQHFLGRDRLQRFSISRHRDALISILELGGEAAAIARRVLFPGEASANLGGKANKSPGARSVGDGA